MASTDELLELGAIDPRPSKAEELDLAREKVRNGVAWLGEFYPEWREKVSLGRLQISSGENCICGQLGSSAMGSVWPPELKASSGLAWNRPLLERLGFIDSPGIGYEALQRAWEEELLRDPVPTDAVRR